MSKTLGHVILQKSAAARMQTARNVFLVTIRKKTAYGLIHQFSAGAGRKGDITRRRGGCVTLIMQSGGLCTGCVLAIDLNTKSCFNLGQTASGEGRCVKGLPRLIGKGDSEVPSEPSG